MNRLFFLSSLAVALLLACFISPMASEMPDGLDKYAEDHAIESRETPLWNRAPMADYAAPFASNERLSTGLAGGIGTLLTFGLLILGGKALAARRRIEPEEAACKP